MNNFNSKKALENVDNAIKSLEVETTEQGSFLKVKDLLGRSKYISDKGLVSKIEDAESLNKDLNINGSVYFGVISPVSATTMSKAIRVHNTPIPLYDYPITLEEIELYCNVAGTCNIVVLQKTSIDNTSFQVKFSTGSISLSVGRNFISIPNWLVESGWYIGFEMGTALLTGVVTTVDGTSLLLSSLTGPASNSFYQIQFKARLNTVVNILDQVETNTQSIQILNTRTADQKLNYTGNNLINFSLNGVDASVTLSDNYTVKGEPDTLMILCHGNGQNLDTSRPSVAFMNFLKTNKISFANIKMQDQTASPFTTKASGWGNEICIQRVINLYNHLMTYYNFHKSVILCGRSMGGLSMGILAHTKPFPIRFCLGIGIVPSLKTMFTNGGTNRKEPIRNAFGMASNGSDDANIDTFIQGYDWFSKSMLDIAGVKHKIFDQRLYILAGNDTTVQNEFGGDAKYIELRDAVNRAGGYCYYTLKNGVGHDDGSLFIDSVTQGVWLKEMGIPIVAL